MAFETAVRNPERYLGLLSAIKEFDGKVLSDDNLLAILAKLYRQEIVTSEDVDLSADDKTLYEQIKKVNASRNADGGFPKGYQARFWTYMRTPSEFGFVLARYNQELRISKLALKMVDGVIDEQEAFAVQAFRGNRRSPYRNVSNDFNYFKFIFSVLENREQQNKQLTLEQFIVSMFSKAGDVQEYLSIIDQNSFGDFDSTYNYVIQNFHISTKQNTVTKEYPDVVIRVLLITGLISIRYAGKKFIGLNKNKIDFFTKLRASVNPISDNAKHNEDQFFKEMNAEEDKFLQLILSSRQEDKIDASHYTQTLKRLIDEYNIDEALIAAELESIESGNTQIEAFREIPKPLKLEFYIAILVTLVYESELQVRPNYKADHEGKPYSHAPGGGGDIDVYSHDTYWLIEVTLIRNKTQQLNSETTTVFRHMINAEEFKDRQHKYLSFVAPYVHPDTDDYFEIEIFKNREKLINFSSYPITEFIETTKDKKNLSDMEENTKRIIKKFAGV